MSKGQTGCLAAFFGCCRGGQSKKKSSSVGNRVESELNEKATQTIEVVNDKLAPVLRNSAFYKPIIAVRGSKGFSVQGCGKLIICNKELELIRSLSPSISRIENVIGDEVSGEESVLRLFSGESQDLAKKVMADPFRGCGSGDRVRLKPITPMQFCKVGVSVRSVRMRK